MMRYKEAVALAVACASLSAAVSLFLGAAPGLAFIIFLVAFLLTLFLGPIILGVGE